MYRKHRAFLQGVAIVTVLICGLAASSSAQQGGPVIRNLTNSDDIAPHGYAWSPDHTKIAFSTGTLHDLGEMYVMNADGSQRRKLARESSGMPSWSPDGTRIAFSSSLDYLEGRTLRRDPDIYVIDLDGSNLRNLTGRPTQYNSSGVRRQADDRYPTWSPDGTKIAYVSELLGGGPTNSSWGLVVMNADGSNPTVLQGMIDQNDRTADIFTPWTQTNAQPAGASRPIWSPDGEKIAFVLSSQILREVYVRDVRRGQRRTSEVIEQGKFPYIIDADGTNLRRLTDHIDFRGAGPGISNYPYVQVNASLSDGGAWGSWSPDGTKFAFHVTGFNFQEQTTPVDTSIYVVNAADGSNPVELTEGVDGDPVLSAAPTYSPDGARIAFLLFIPNEYRTLIVMNADGSNPRHLPNPPTSGRASVALPLWSPDGTQISYYYGGRDPESGYSADLYTVPVGEGEGGRPETGEHGNTRDQATEVGLDSTTPGALEQAGDLDYFRVDVTQAGRLTVETTGETDTVGVFQGAQGRSIAEDDDAGAETNFRIARDVSPGTYYVKVTGYNRTATGAYTLRIAFTPAEGHGNTERGDRRATLLNLSPWQAWVHLYCLKDRAGPDGAPCAVTFECNSFSGEPVTWPVEVGPKTIFSYWPNKTAPDGTAADLQAALIAAGKPEDEARRRTTCEVFSPDPLTVRGYTLFGGQPTLVPVAEPARPAVAAAPGERRRQATLPNLSPGQAWLHLYCLKDRGPDAAPCAVTFECNSFSGEPVTWPVTVAPKTIFSYWPNKTVDGLSADLEAALIAAGKPEDEARRRTTCEVSSADPIAARGYTRFNGQPTLVPVTAY